MTVKREYKYVDVEPDGVGDDTGPGLLRALEKVNILGEDGWRVHTAFSPYTLLMEKSVVTDTE